MDDVSRGQTSPFVRLLQRMLNKAARAEHIGGIPLVVDGRFGRLTAELLATFQSRHRIHAPAGTCNYTTWNALGLTYEVDYPITLRGQPSTTSCWATAAAMIKGDFFPTIGAEHLGADGGLYPTIDDIQAFGASLGWTMPDHSPDLPEALGWLSETPLWIACQGSNFAHALAWTGGYGDGTPSGTLAVFHDPWPPGHGRIYGCMIDDLHEIGTAAIRCPCR